MIKDEYMKKVDETKITNLRITSEEKQLMKNKAKLYTNGNLSEWIRFSAIYLEPPKKFLSVKKDKKKKGL